MWRPPLQAIWRLPLKIIWRTPLEGIWRPSQNVSLALEEPQELPYPSASLSLLTCQYWTGE